MKKIVIITTTEDIYSVCYNKPNIEYLCQLIGAEKLNFLERRENEILTFLESNGDFISDTIFYGILYDKNQSNIKTINALVSGGLGRNVYGDIIIIKDNRKDLNEDILSNLHGFDYKEESSDDGIVQEGICEHWYIQNFFQKEKKEHKEAIKEIHKEYDRKDTNFGTVEY